MNDVVILRFNVSALQIIHRRRWMFMLCFFRPSFQVSGFEFQVSSFKLPRHDVGVVVLRCGGGGGEGSARFKMRV